jgi:hypothetical protein
MAILLRQKINMIQFKCRHMMHKFGKLFRARSLNK